ncbi:UNVERIFIED_CONTAM: Protein salt-induced and EIN3/EIL1-dependent 1 [Sesamum indicum]
MNYNYKDESPKLELKLNLSPPRDRRYMLSPNGAMSPTEASPRTSCVSQETSPDGNRRYSSSPEASSMMLVGCPRCLMYVMLFEEDPKCPKCKSTVLLDFLHEDRSRRLKN